MRSILVYADRTPAMPARLDTALALTRMTSGHLSIMVDTPVASYTSVDLMGGSFIAADAIAESMARDDAYADELEARLAREDVPFAVIRCEDEPVDALADAAKLADVVVLSQGCDFAGALALSIRCPLLLVPNIVGAGLRMPIRRIGIAWDSGTEAAAALRAAVPLLAGATVQVITVLDGVKAPATAALRYLSRHGVDAEYVGVDRVGSTAETLAATAVRLELDLLVLGAYGRSRLSEYLFGGVTRHFLNSPVGPALLLAG